MFKNLSMSKKSKNNKSKSSACFLNIRATGKLIFLTLGAKEAFNRLRQAFTKALILQHFDPECHIWIETDASSYGIDGVLRQLSSNWIDPNGSILSKFDFSQQHLIAYFFRKMIPAETQYKTYNAELLAIVEAFKTWRHYLKSCK